MISVQITGSTKNTEAYLKRLARLDFRKVLESCGAMGVAALEAATPIESGLAAGSWDFQVSGSRASCTITWTNNDTENGFPVAIMLQYGYSTGTGGYVQGRDYINPAMRPVFDKIEEAVRRAVTSS